MTILARSKLDDLFVESEGGGTPAGAVEFVAGVPGQKLGLSDAPSAGALGELGRGVKRGLAETGAGYANTLRLDKFQASLEGYLDRNRQLQPNATKGAGANFWNYGGSGLGQNAASIALMAGSALLAPETGGASLASGGLAVARGAKAASVLRTALTTPKYVRAAMMANTGLMVYGRNLDEIAADLPELDPASQLTFAVLRTAFDAYTEVALPGYERGFLSGMTARKLMAQSVNVADSHVIKRAGLGLMGSLRSVGSKVVAGGLGEATDELVQRGGYELARSMLDPDYSEQDRNDFVKAVPDILYQAGVGGLFMGGLGGTFNGMAEASTRVRLDAMIQGKSTVKQEVDTKIEPLNPQATEANRKNGVIDMEAREKTQTAFNALRAGLGKNLQRYGDIIENLSYAMAKSEMEFDRTKSVRPEAYIETLSTVVINDPIHSKALGEITDPVKAMEYLKSIPGIEKIYTDIGEKMEVVELEKQLATIRRYHQQNTPVLQQDEESVAGQLLAMRSGTALVEGAFVSRGAMRTIFSEGGKDLLRRASAQGVIRNVDTGKGVVDVVINGDMSGFVVKAGSKVSGLGQRLVEDDASMVDRLRKLSGQSTTRAQQVTTEDAKAEDIKQSTAKREGIQSTTSQALADARVAIIEAGLMQERLQDFDSAWESAGEEIAAPMSEEDQMAFKAQGYSVNQVKSMKATERASILQSGLPVPQQALMVDGKAVPAPSLDLEKLVADADAVLGSQKAKEAAKRAKDAIEKQEAWKAKMAAGKKAAAAARVEQNRLAEIEKMATEFGNEVAERFKSEGKSAEEVAAMAEKMRNYRVTKALAELPDAIVQQAPGGEALGAYSKPYRLAMFYSKADATTVVHEMFHHLISNRLMPSNLYAQLMSEYGRVGADGEREVGGLTAEENAANAFLAFIRDSKLPKNSKMVPVFTGIQKILAAHAERIGKWVDDQQTTEPLQISSELKGIFAKLSQGATFGELEDLYAQGLENSLFFGDATKLSQLNDRLNTAVNEAAKVLKVTPDAIIKSHLETKVDIFGSARSVADLNPEQKARLMAMVEADEVMAAMMPRREGDRILYQRQGPAGEYWYADGQLMFADGDIGDMNHESFAIQAATGKILDALDIEDNGDSILLSDYDSEVQEALGLDDPTGAEQNKALVSRLVESGMKEDEAIATVDAANSNGDARVYGVERLGWMRVKGSDVDVASVNASTMRSAADAVESAMDEEGVESEDDPEVNLFDYKTQRYYRSVPLSVLKSGDVGAMRVYSDQRGDIRFQRDPRPASRSSVIMAYKSRYPAGQDEDSKSHMTRIMEMIHEDAQALFGEKVIIEGEGGVPKVSISDKTMTSPDMWAQLQAGVGEATKAQPYGDSEELMVARDGAAKAIREGNTSAYRNSEDDAAFGRFSPKRAKWFAKGAFRSLNANLQSTYSLIETLTKGRQDNALYQLKPRLRNADARLNAIQDERTAKLFNVMRDAGVDLGTYFADTVEMGREGNKINVQKDKILFLYMASQFGEQPRHKQVELLVKSRALLFGKTKVDEANSWAVIDEAIAYAKAHPEIDMVARHMHEMNDAMFEQAAIIHEQITGKRPEKVDGVYVTLSYKDGRVREQTITESLENWSMKVNPSVRQSPSAFEHRSDDAGDKMYWSGLNGYMRHTDSLARYIAFAGVHYDMQQLVKSVTDENGNETNPIINSIVETYGDDTYLNVFRKHAVRMMTANQTAHGRPKTIDEHWTGALVKNAATGFLSWSPFVVATQFASLGPASAYLTGHMTKLLGNAYSFQRAWASASRQGLTFDDLDEVKLVRKYSPQVADMFLSEAAMAMRVGQELLSNNRLSFSRVNIGKFNGAEFIEKGYRGMYWGDASIRIPTWITAFQVKVEELEGTTMDRAQIERQAADYANDVISATHNTKSTLEKGLAQTEFSGFGKSVLAFTNNSFALFRFQINDVFIPLAEQYRKSAGDRQGINRAVAGLAGAGARVVMDKRIRNILMVGGALPGVLIYSIAKRRPPKDLAELAWAMLSGMTLLNIPVLGTAIMYGAYTGQTDFSTMYDQCLNGVAKAFGNITKGEFDRKDFNSITRTVSQLTGIPNYPPKVLGAAWDQVVSGPDAKAFRDAVGFKPRD